MTYSELTEACRFLNNLAQKTAGVLGTAGRAMTAPVAMAGRGLWNASHRAGGPVFAPLLFGGTVLGGAAIASKAISQAKNYNHGFNPELQESMVRS